MHLQKNLIRFEPRNFGLGQCERAKALILKDNVIQSHVNYILPLSLTLGRRYSRETDGIDMVDRLRFCMTLCFKHAYI
jgi:hypothetical protein